MGVRRIRWGLWPIRLSFDLSSGSPYHFARQFLTYIWVDLLATVLGLWVINSAINGAVRTYRRSGSFVLYRFRTAAPRLLYGVAGLAVLAWVIIDLRRKFPQ